MAGSVEGGKKARETNRRKYGDDYYSQIGRVGGKRSTTGGFASNKIGADGLTGRERARIAGAKGGTISRRGKNKTREELVDENGLYKLNEVTQDEEEIELHFKKPEEP